MKTNYILVFLLSVKVIFMTSCATTKQEAVADTKTEATPESQNEVVIQVKTVESVDTAEEVTEPFREYSGLSVEDAVPIAGKLDLRKRQKKEIEWIKLHYPEYRMGMHSMLFKRKENKWFDIVTIFPRRGGEGITLYFNVEM